MDNQQRSLDARLSWLGGIIDGEGMITAIRRTNGEGFIPRLSIVNTDLKIIQECVAIFEEMELPHYLQTKAGKGTWLTKYELLVNGMKRCDRVLPVLIPHLVAKRERAERLLALCRERLDQPSNTPWSEQHIANALAVRGRI